MAQGKKDQNLETSFQRLKTELINIRSGTNCNEIVYFFGEPDKIYEGNYVIFYYKINQKKVYALNFGLSDYVLQLSEIEGGTEDKFYVDGIEKTIFLDTRFGENSNDTILFENPKKDKFENYLEKK